MASPELLSYLQQVHNAFQQNEGERPNINPFETGVQRAIAATRQSMGIPSREDQNQEALSLGFMNMGRAMGRPASNTWEWLNNSLSAAEDAYLQQHAQQQQLNAQAAVEAMRQQEEEKKFLQHAYEFESAEKRHRESLAEQKRMHDLLNTARLSKLKGEEKGESESSISPYGIKEIPVNQMFKKDSKKYEETVLKNVESIQKNKKALDAIEGMRKIFDQYPDIGTSFFNALEENEGNENSTWNIIGRQIADLTGNKETRTAIQKLRKYSNELNLDTVLGISGKTATDMLKQAIKAASPGGRLTYDAFNDIANSWEKSALININKARIQEEALARGMYPVLSDMDLSHLPSPEKSISHSSMIPSEEDEDLSHLSDEEIANLIR